MSRSDGEIEAFYAAVLAAPAHRVFGLSLLRWQPGEAILEFIANAACLGPAGEVHGGVISLLFEPTAMFALFPLLPADRYAVTADMHVQCLKPVNAHARVALSGRVVRTGKQLAFCSASAMVGDEIYAAAQVTKSIIVKAQ